MQKVVLVAGRTTMKLSHLPSCPSAFVLTAFVVALRGGKVNKKSAFRKVHSQVGSARENILKAMKDSEPKKVEKKKKWAGNFTPPTHYCKRIHRRFAFRIDFFPKICYSIESFFHTGVF